MLPGLLFIVALGSAAVPWVARRISRRIVLAAFLVGIAASVIGAALALTLYPWTDAMVLLVGLTSGILLGRVLPAYPGRFGLWLLFFSVLDIAQWALTSSAPPSGASSGVAFPALAYLNFSLPPPAGPFKLGIFDIAAVGMLSEWWRLQTAPLWVAEAPGLAGFLLADLVVVLTPLGDLPLIPFLAAGWLVSEALWGLLKARVVARRSS